MHALIETIKAEPWPFIAGGIVVVTMILAEFFGKGDAQIPRHRRLGLGVEPSGRAYLPAAASSMIDVLGPVPRQHLGRISLVLALGDPDLLGAALFRGLAKFGGDGIRVHQLLGQARLGNRIAAEKIKYRNERMASRSRGRPEGVAA